MKPDELVREARKEACCYARSAHCYDSFGPLANLLRDLADALEESQKELGEKWTSCQIEAEMNYDRDVAQEETIKRLEEELQQVKGEVPCPDCLGGGAQADSAPTEPFECKKDWGWRKCSACKGSGKKYNTE